tara:strand:- start:287 stop:532 length:246 start_codon:yes stop_codon:yes gene_type:complete
VEVHVVRHPAILGIVEKEVDGVPDASADHRPRDPAVKGPEVHSGTRHHLGDTLFDPEVRLYRDRIIAPHYRLQELPLSYRV